jgi:hypothetical protein
MLLNISPDPVYYRKHSMATKGALSLVAVATLGLLAAPCAYSDSNALLLKLWSRLVGATDLLVYKQGIKLSIPSRQLTILMLPPAWNVQFLNLRTKVYCQCPADKWTAPMTRAASFFRPGDPSSLKSSGAEGAIYEGLPCRKHILKLPAGTNSEGKKAWELLLIKQGVQYTIADHYYPKAVTAALARTLGVIQLDGIPLALTCVSNRGKVEVELKLTGHSYVPFKNTDLQVPRDYKLVGTATEVTGTATDNAGFAEFIR